jgi:hypothetical protein
MIDRWFVQLKIFCSRVRCSSDERQLGLFLIRHRDSLRPMPDDADRLAAYKNLVLTAVPTEQHKRFVHTVELLKYQGYIDLVDIMRQWSIPVFPVHRCHLQQQGLMSGGHLARILRQLRLRWQMSHFQMSKDELIEFGFQSGLFYL